MNTEIPNNNPTTETPVEPVVTPVVENPVPTVPEVPSDTVSAPELPTMDAPMAPEAPVAPAPMPDAVPTVDPVVPEAAPADTPNLGFGAAPVNAPGEPTSITPIEPAPAAMPETVPMAPEAPVAPVMSEPAPAPMPEAAPMAPEAPVAPVMPEPAPAPMPETAPAAPAVPEEPFIASSVAPETPAQGGLTVEPMPGAANSLPDQNITPAPMAEAKPKKGKGGLVAIIIVVVLLLLAVGGWFVYTKVLLTPEKVYETTVRQLFEAAEDTKENNKFAGIVLDPEKPFTIEGNLSLDSNSEQLEALKNYSLDFKLGADYKNNQLLAGAAINENGKVVASPEVYFTNNKLYVQCKEVYESIFEIGEYELDLSEYIQNSDNGDVQVVTDALEEAIIAAIKAGELTKTSTKFNGSSVTDNTYAINDSNYGTVIKAALTNLKSNDSAMQALANLSESEKADVVAYFDELLATDMTSATSINIKVHLYTGGLLGNKLYGFEFEYNDQKLVTYTQDDEDFTLKVVIDETTSVEAVKKGTVTTVTCLDTEYPEDKLVITITETTDNLNIALTVETYAFSIDLTTKESDGGVNETLKVSVTETELNETISLILDLTAKQGTLEIPAVEKAVDYYALSSEERQDINKNVDSILASSELFAIYSTYASTLFETDEIGDDVVGFGTLEDSLGDYEWAAFNAYDMTTMTSDSICFSNKYLISKGYLDEDYADYTGSVMIKKGTGVETDTYYIWVSDGESSYKKADYWASDYTLSTDTTVSNNCDGLAKYNCTDDGKCS